MFDSENTVIESPLATLSTTTITYSIPKLSYYTITVTYHPVKLPVTYNPCHPWLSVPQRIYTLQPEWSSCIQNIKGLRDPPTWLTTGSEFSPVTSRAPALPTTTIGASAAPVLVQPTRTKTASPTIDPGSPPAGIPSPAQTSRPPEIATLGGSTLTINTETALQATIGGTTVAITTNSMSELVGTIRGTTFTFTTNSESALVGTIEGTIVTAHSEPVLIGTIGGTAVTFTTNSESALVGTIAGTTVTAKPVPASRPGTQTRSAGLEGTYTSTGSSVSPSYRVMLVVFWVLCITHYTNSEWYLA